MKYEVDNTTEVLLSELQGSIKETIGTIEEGQEDLKSLVGELKDATRDLSGNLINDIKDELGDSEKNTRQKITEVLEGIEEFKGLINDLGTKIAADNNESLSLQKDNTAKIEEKVTSMEKALAEQKKYVDEMCRQVKNVEEKIILFDEIIREIKQNMTDGLDMIGSKVANVYKIEDRNNRILEGVARYLMQPGIKRLFKGMEEIKDAEQ